MDNKYKGYLLVLGTAIISGFSIFINKFGVVDSNPVIFTFVKNLIAAIPFLFLSIPYLKQLKYINLKEKISLLLIAIIGGSIPFILFFKGLSITSAANASFIHKTLFIYIALFGVFWLKEKLNWISVTGIVALLIGSLLFFKIQPNNIGTGELYILAATIMWAVEILISKKLLSKISANLVSFSRMFIGSIMILSYIFIIGQQSILLTISSRQWMWLLIGGLLLFAYVLTFYRGLKYIKATEATAILAIGSPITSLLTLGFLSKGLSGFQPWGIVVIAVGIIVVLMSDKLGKLITLQNAGSPKTG